MSTHWPMLRTMMRLQIEHNELVVPEWRTHNGERPEFYRAVWVECAELLDHFGWKWWKQQSTDLGQVKLEIVDIWHFGLSMMILRDEVVPELAEQLAQPTGDGDFRAYVELLAQTALADRAFSVTAFSGLLATLPFSFTELFELYVGKNMLNRFRQRHGYKQGTYRKLWAGREDNEHLLELMRTLDSKREDFVEALDTALELRYGALAP